MACEMKPLSCDPAKLKGRSQKPKEISMKTNRNAWLVVVSLALFVVGSPAWQVVSAEEPD